MNGLTIWRYIARAMTSIKIIDHQMWDHESTHEISQESNTTINDINKMIYNDECTYILKIHSTSDDKQKDQRSSNMRSLVDSWHLTRRIEFITQSHQQDDKQWCINLPTVKMHITSVEKHKHRTSSNMRSLVDSWHITRRIEFEVQQHRQDDKQWWIDLQAKDDQHERWKALT